MKTKISSLSRVLLLITAIALFVSIFVPLWRIELAAPQYPEGLVLQIFTFKLGGNVEIINGLNHYIGMKTLHADDFVEFTVLPFIIGAFALASLIVMIAGKKKGVNILFGAFVLFGIIAMVDFWRWEYDYGHNLNPNAAIIVPGMAYQPPLIGFKQLLNFGAYSIPDFGGWLFIASGLLMLISVVIEYRKSKMQNSVNVIALTGIISLFLVTSCSPVEKEPIKLNKEHCSFCNMMISDPRFGSELITEKGRIYKFDDAGCMKNFIVQDKGKYSAVLVSDYLPPNELFPANKMYLITGPNIGSPMHGNIAAFSDKESASKYAVQLGAEQTDWETITK